MPNVLIKHLPNAVEAQIQLSMHNLSNKLPLYAAIFESEPIVLYPRSRAAVKTGMAIELPANVEGLIMPDEDLGYQTGLTVLNSPGTIDPDFRGEIMVILINLGEEKVIVRRGMRIAFLRLREFTRAEFIVVENLAETERATNGLGSTGTT